MDVAKEGMEPAGTAPPAFINDHTWAALSSSGKKKPEEEGATLKVSGSELIVSVRSYFLVECFIIAEQQRVPACLARH